MAQNVQMIEKQNLCLVWKLNVQIMPFTHGQSGHLVQQHVIVELNLEIGDALTRMQDFFLWKIRNVQMELINLICSIKKWTVKLNHVQGMEVGLLGQKNGSLAMYSVEKVNVLWKNCTIVSSISLLTGVQIKRRFCTNPTPTGGGTECSGEDKMTKKCKAPDCPGKFLFSNCTSTLWRHCTTF